MKVILYGIVVSLFAAAGLFAQTSDIPSEVIKVDAQLGKGFSYPYYLYVPAAMRDVNLRNQTHTILVVPNNTGKTDDDLAFHEADVKRRIVNNGKVASQFGVAVLIPVFSRPATDWKIYTHALDRDSMLTDKKEYSRYDRQLIAMIDHARSRLKAEKLKFDERVLIMGFSASGMFANRFTFLHPTRVKAAAIGSPGGWAIAPSAAYKDKMLRYPLGTGDFKTVTGKSFDLENVRKVPIFVFLGDQDDNDSLVFGDGYDSEDKDLVFQMFGKTPVERWEISKKLYADGKLNAEFKLYPGVKHSINQEMLKEIVAFLSKHK